MNIDVARDGGAAVLRLAGRLDRAWAEDLSGTLEDLLQDGIRSVTIDFAAVTYLSTEATKVLTRWQRELAVLRGEVHLVSLPPAIQKAFAAAGLDAATGGSAGQDAGLDLRRSSWHSRADFETSGRYELTASTAPGTLICRLHGDPTRLTESPPEPDPCQVVELTGGFGLGVGAIGGTGEGCRERLGELVAVEGCIACFPTDGARAADYLVGDERNPPCAALASGLTCEGGFSNLLRFGTGPDASDVPLSELARISLDASGGEIAGLVIAAETARLCGARLRQSPLGQGAPLRFEIPAVRDWLSFAQERARAMTTTIIAGVVARSPKGPLAGHLRPLGTGVAALGGSRLYGHLHAAVFSYQPVPRRTVELAALVRGLFDNHRLRDVLHLVWDDRGETGVGESTLVRGVAWVGPITQIN